MAVTWDLYVHQGSYEPTYITISDPTTGSPLDLTASGYRVTGVVATRAQGDGTVLATLPDPAVVTPSVWRRTADGRIYFQPDSTVSAGWTFRYGHHQVELTHPSGETVRVAQGRFQVDPELVLAP